MGIVLSYSFRTRTHTCVVWGGLEAVYCTCACLNVNNAEEEKAIANSSGEGGEALEKGNEKITR